jgi:hypothetical protein
LPSVGITQEARAGVLVAVAQVPPWDMAIQATQLYLVYFLREFFSLYQCLCSIYLVILICKVFGS